MFGMMNAGVRNRRLSAAKKAASRLQLALAGPLLRIKHMPTRAKLILFLSSVCSLVFWIVVISRLTRNHLTEEDFLEARKCPVCYGMTMCHSLFNGDISFTGFSRLRFLDMVNVKNVHFGKYRDKDVVLKKLGHNDELKKFDDAVCEETDYSSGCEVAKVIFKSPKLKSLRNSEVTPGHLQGLSDLTHCPSNRLLMRIVSRFQEQTEPGRRMLLRDKIMLLTILKINQEPLLLQAFPEEEGWPFPAYVGACGRFIVESNAGKMLGDFFHAPFHKRVDLAYQIMKIADLLTNNKDHFALYWTDLSFDNLAVNLEGKVSLIDLENILVVDKLAIEKGKKTGWDVLHESEYDKCSKGSNCLSFDPDTLCQHMDSDHNYYAVCRSLLSRYAEDELGRSGGLLHSMPDYAKDDYELEYLLSECAKPSRSKGRILIKDRLIKTLDKLRIDALEKQMDKKPEKLKSKS